ncbi:MAG: hypothetical protein KDD70_05345 [Bdellovibrionales bacterium]|nr:hypothetical protein [Bdellovibrionales bacterium]
MKFIAPLSRRPIKRGHFSRGGILRKASEHSAKSTALQPGIGKDGEPAASRILRNRAIILSRALVEVDKIRRGRIHDFLGNAPR